MASSSSSKSRKKEHVEYNGDIPAWIETFCTMIYDETCPSHEYYKFERPRSALLRSFCLNCQTTNCTFCITEENTHRGHKLIKVGLYNEMDAIKMTEIQLHFDCSDVQVFRQKGSSYVTLHPLPSKGRLTRQDINCCRSCCRALSRPDLQLFCCISCKVEVLKWENGRSKYQTIYEAANTLHKLGRKEHDEHEGGDYEQPPPKRIR